MSGIETKPSLPCIPENYNTAVTIFREMESDYSRAKKTLEDKHLDEVELTLMLTVREASIRGQLSDYYVISALAAPTQPSQKGLKSLFQRREQSLDQITYYFPQTDKNNPYLLTVNKHQVGTKPTPEMADPTSEQFVGPAALFKMISSTLPTPNTERFIEVEDRIPNTTLIKLPKYEMSFLSFEQRMEIANALLIDLTQRDLDEPIEHQDKLETAVLAYKSELEELQSIHNPRIRQRLQAVLRNVNGCLGKGNHIVIEEKYVLDRQNGSIYVIPPGQTILSTEQLALVVSEGVEPSDSEYINVANRAFKTIMGRIDSQRNPKIPHRLLP